MSFEAEIEHARDLGFRVSSLHESDYGTWQATLRSMTKVDGKIQFFEPPMLLGETPEQAVSLAIEKAIRNGRFEKSPPPRRSVESLL